MNAETPKLMKQGRFFMQFFRNGVYKDAIYRR